MWNLNGRLCYYLSILIMKEEKGMSVLMGIIGVTAVLILIYLAVILLRGDKQ